MILSCCGLQCNDCEFFGTTCQGCHQVMGKTFWAVTGLPTGVCPLFDCAVNKKNLKNCGECSDLPCETFLQMKDPSTTEEEHRKGIIERVTRLTSN
jgi:hypothetical protein